MSKLADWYTVSFDDTCVCSDVRPPGGEASHTHPLCIRPIELQPTSVRNCSEAIINHHDNQSKPKYHMSHCIVLCGGNLKIESPIVRQTEKKVMNKRR